MHACEKTHPYMPMRACECVVNKHQHMPGRVQTCILPTVPLLHADARRRERAPRDMHCDTLYNCVCVHVCLHRLLCLLAYKPYPSLPLAGAQAP